MAWEIASYNDRLKLCLTLSDKIYRQGNLCVYKGRGKYYIHDLNFNKRLGQTQSLSFAIWSIKLIHTEKISPHSSENSTELETIYRISYYNKYEFKYQLTSSLLLKRDI